MFINFRKKVTVALFFFVFEVRTVRRDAYLHAIWSLFDCLCHDSPMKYKSLLTGYNMQMSYPLHMLSNI